VAHLKLFRQGWENEHLATYLLSRIAFIANPITVADDIGSDFLCTLFEPREIDNRQQLFPLRSFALQVKSSRRRVRSDNKIEYLNRLELPFFLGVVHRHDLSLSIFSGEFLPMMFTHFGPPQKLTLCPVQKKTLNCREAYTRKGRSYDLKLPFVVKLAAADTPTVSDAMRKVLDALCARMHSNISTRTGKEYIYHLDDDGRVQFFAGPDSAKTFRHNFYLRLAEVFYNLEWLLDNAPKSFNGDEYALYAELYTKLNDEVSDLPPVLRGIFNQMHGKAERERSSNA
jgi:hypothetical protein